MHLKKAAAAMLIAALAVSCEKPADPASEPGQKEDPGQQEDKKDVPQADLLDIVFAEDGSARDVSANGLGVTLLDSPMVATVYNETYKRWTAHFNHAGADITSGYYKCAYAKGDKTDKALARGHTLECVFSSDILSDGGKELKMFSGMDSGGTGFLVSKTANGKCLTFLPNITTGSSSNWIWCGSGINPEPGRYYHVVGVYDKEAGTAKVYVDGVLKGTKDAKGSYWPQKNAAAYWFAVGADAAKDKANSGWKGDVVLARIYSGALTAEQVAALFDEVRTAPDPAGHFCIRDITFLESCTIAAGYSFNIYGSGFAAGDRIMFQSIPGGSSYECSTTIADGVAKARIPGSMQSGKYRIVVMRGDRPYVLGKTDITIGGDASNPAGVKVVAHRGVHTSAAENSIAALKAAQEAGVYGAEFDIWITTDGRCVVNHDSTYPGDSHVIENSTFADLSGVKLSNGESIPTLEAYLDQGLKAKGVKMVCEIKKHSSETRNSACFDAAWKAVCDRGMQDQVVWITFSWDLCCYIHKTAPGVHVQYLCSSEGSVRTPDQVAAAGISGIDYKTNIMDAHPGFIAQAHAKSLAVNVWTVDTDSDMVKYMYAGADMITTNKVAELQALISKAFIEK